MGNHMIAEIIPLKLKDGSAIQVKVIEFYGFSHITRDYELKVALPDGQEIKAYFSKLGEIPHTREFTNHREMDSCK